MHICCGNVNRMPIVDDRRRYGYSKSRIFHECAYKCIQRIGHRDNQFFINEIPSRNTINEQWASQEFN